MSDATVAGLLRLEGEAIDAAERELLLAHVLERSRSWLYAHPEATVPEGGQARYRDLLARRKAGEPVAYLTGQRGFWSLELTVTPATLIPRPETELLVEQALERLPVAAPARVADLGTGSGAVALAIAQQRPQAQVVATDISAEALAVAQHNARRHALVNVTFRQGSWWEPLQDQQFDLVVSNPPYIAAGDPHLTCGDLRFEPMTALVAGDDGLDAIRAIVTPAASHLRPGGWLLLEHGWDQGRAVAALLAEAGFVHVATVQDWEQRDRVTLGARP